MRTEAAFAHQRPSQVSAYFESGGEVVPTNASATVSRVSSVPAPKPSEPVSVTGSAPTVQAPISSTTGSTAPPEDYGAVLQGDIVLLADGRKIKYHEYGAPDGFPVIFLNGNISSRLFEPMFEDSSRLSAEAGARVIAFDRPGNLPPWHAFALSEILASEGVS